MGNKKKNQQLVKPIEVIFNEMQIQGRNCVFIQSYKNRKGIQRYLCTNLPDDEIESPLARVGIVNTTQTMFSGTTPCSWTDMLRCPLIAMNRILKNEWGEIKR
jgi:hypothetical protein